MDFSYLMEQKFWQFWQDATNHLCSCRTFAESTTHFFLHFTHFSNQRLILTNNIKDIYKSAFWKRLPHNPKFSFWRREAFITNRKSILEAKTQFNIFREIRFTVILIIRYIFQLIVFTLQLIFLNWQPLLSYVSRIIIQIFQFSIPRYFFSFCCFRYIWLINIEITIFHFFPIWSDLASFILKLGFSRWFHYLLVASFWNFLTYDLALLYFQMKLQSVLDSF